MELPELVRKALEHRGFTVVSDSLALVVRGVEDEYVVVLTDNENPPPLEVEGKKLVIALEEGAEPQGDIFWSREDLEAFIGQALLNEALGKKSPVETISSFEEAFAEQNEPVARELPLHKLGDDVSEAVVSINEIIPFHVIYFSLESGDITDAGIILIDAVDGEAFMAKKPLFIEQGIPGERSKEPEISAERAEELAIDHIIAAHTKEVEDTEDMGPVTVVEKKTISPLRENVSSRYLGLLHIPVVLIEREEGTLAVDASGIIGFRKHY